MIETYKILSLIYDTNMVPNLKTTDIQTTRGNDLRIFKTRFKYDLRKFYFTNTVVDHAWNSLPDWIVMANSTNTFKRRLNAVWLSGNALASINVVALRQTRLVLGWVTVCGRVNHPGM